VAIDKVELGKNQLAVAWNLPIVTTVLAPGEGVDLIADIKGRMHEGCAVEIVLRAPVNVVPRRHMVGAAGFIEHPATGGTRLILRDPASQSFDDVYRAAPTQNPNQQAVDGFPFAGQNRPMVIELVVVQCITKLRAVTLDYPHGAVAAGQVVRLLRCVQGGHEGMHAGGCTCTHLHSDEGISIEGGPVTPDTAPSMCGHGCVGLFDFRDVDVPCCGPGQ
jgi:hypothetical protein